MNCHSFFVFVPTLLKAIKKKKNIEAPLPPLTTPHASQRQTGRVGDMAKVKKRKASPIWDYFQYSSETDRSVCMVEEDGKVCGTQLKGKNPTNLKVHLRSYHKDANCRYLAQLAASASPIEARAESSRSGETPKLFDFLKCRKDSWSVNSQEHSKREEALVNLFVHTGMSTRLCETPAFKEYSCALEPKFRVPGAARLNNLISGRMGNAKKRLKEILKDARKLTLCVDGWSKKGLTASFLGVSACFYHPPGGRVYHALLSLHRLDHPHTGECIARCIDETMVAWDIVGDKVLLVVTDNGSNIVKAVRLLSERPRQEIEPSAHSTRLPPGDGLDDVSWEEEEPESESDEENGDISESRDFGE